MLIPIIWKGSRGYSVSKPHNAVVSHYFAGSVIFNFPQSSKFLFTVLFKAVLRVIFPHISMASTSCYFWQYVTQSHDCQAQIDVKGILSILSLFWFYLISRATAVPLPI